MVISPVKCSSRGYFFVRTTKEKEKKIGVGVNPRSPYVGGGGGREEKRRQGKGKVKAGKQRENGGKTAANYR